MFQFIGCQLLLKTLLGAQLPLLVPNLTAVPTNYMPWLFHGVCSPEKVEAVRSMQGYRRVNFSSAPLYVFG